MDEGELQSKVVEVSKSATENSSSVSNGQKKRSDRTKEKLLVAAQSLLLEHNRLEIPLADIAAHAKTNIALISYHFDGREGLLLAVAMADAQYAIKGLDRLLSSDLSATEKLAAHVSALVHIYAKKPYLQKLIHFLMQAASPESSKKISTFFYQPVAKARHSILQEGIDSGEFWALDPFLADFLIEGACNRIFSSPEAREVTFGTREMTDEQVQSYADHAVEMITRGFKA